MSKKIETFDKSELIAGSPQIFGVNPEVVAGALHDVNEPISLEKAKKAINSFLKRPVGGAK